MANFLYAGLIALGILSMASCETKIKKEKKPNPPKQLTPVKKEPSKKVISKIEQSYEEIKSNTSFNVALIKPEDGKKTDISGSETVYHLTEGTDAETEPALEGPMESVDLATYFQNSLMSMNTEYCNNSNRTNIVQKSAKIGYCTNARQHKQKKIEQYSKMMRTESKNETTKSYHYEFRETLHLNDASNRTIATIGLNYLEDGKVYETIDNFLILGNQIDGFIVKVRNLDDPEALATQRTIDMRFDGHMIDSYQINDKLYITSLFEPKANDSFLKTAKNNDTAKHSRQLSSQVMHLKFLPKIINITTDTVTLQAEQCFNPDIAKFNKAIITLITALDINTGNTNNICFIGALEKSFITDNHIYLYSLKDHQRPQGNTNKENHSTVTLHQITLSPLTYVSSVKL